MGTVYGVASGILHGRAAHPAEAAVLYADILGAARELLVPLAHRAARVPELVALQHPGAAEAKELAGWAGPARRGLLLPLRPRHPVAGRSAGARAAPADAGRGSRRTVAGRAWLNAPADKAAPGAWRSQQIAASGRSALDALLGLAVRHWDAVAPGGAVGPRGPARRGDGAVDRCGGGAADRSGRGRARRPPGPWCGRRAGEGPDGGRRSPRRRRRGRRLRRGRG
ncbi:hypothetical protein SBD_1827 [Streptomyces bottropensis ATCC 25435]|uniref:Uncharacterized protein n=1 Tax=Streptomyces bottropensis ATCC 25435 TaxID=1054862 RepID=M3FUW7_9ACTN|nr:hypothetical protein SBD_1827 [Streptomyces bottropensis ATCC 25435]